MHTHTASRLLDNSEALERGGRKLNIGQRLLAETEGVGAAVLEDLSRQRETIQHARAKVSDCMRGYILNALKSNGRRAELLTLGILHLYL